MSNNPAKDRLRNNIRSLQDEVLVFVHFIARQELFKRGLAPAFEEPDGPTEGPTDKPTKPLIKIVE